MCGLEFDGVNQYVDCGDSDDFTPVLSDGFYICGWFVFDDASAADQSLVAKYNSDLDWRCLCDGGSYSFVIRDDGGSAYILRRGNLSPTSSGVTYFIEFIYDGGVVDTSLKIYQNLAREDDTSAGSGSFDNPLNGSDPVRFATAQSSKYLDGTAWDIRIYNRALSLAERQSIYHSRGADNITNGLVGRWLMNEGTEGATASGASSCIDISGHGTHGTPAGTPTYEASPAKLISPILMG